MELNGIERIVFRLNRCNEWSSVVESADRCYIPEVTEAFVIHKSGWPDREGVTVPGKVIARKETRVLIIVFEG